MARIKPRSDGRYALNRIIEGKRKYFYGNSPEECEDKARAACAHNITSADTLKTWLDYWLDTITKPNVDIGTYNNYSALIKKHITDDYLGRMRIRDISTQKLRQFLQMKLETLAPASVWKLHMFLKSSLRQASADGVILKSPAESIKRPKAAEKQNKYLHSAQIRKLIAASRFTEHKTLLLVAWTSGLRREELLGLYWTDLEKGKLTVRRAVKLNRQVEDELKTKSAYRTIPIPKETIIQLDKWKSEQSRKNKVVDINARPLIFPDGQEPYEPIVITRWFTRLCKRIGIDADMYDLRHTFATNLAIAGVHPSKIQYLMGHSSPAMAIKVYTHINVEHLGDIANIVADGILEKVEAEKEVSATES